MMGGGMMGMGFGLTGLLFMFLFWGGLVALAIFLVSALFPRDARPAAPDDQGLAPARFWTYATRGARSPASNTRR